MIDTEIRTLDNGLISYPALSVSPIGLTSYRMCCNADGESPLKNLGIRPPVDNQEKGFISKKGAKSIRNAVYWLLYSVDKNLILNGSGKKKVGFFTLTLPSKQIHSDKQIKSECLNHLLTVLRQDYQVTKYIWKAEKQENGNIHFHILTDTFLPVVEMREKWNGIINKLGYVHEYSKRMRKMCQAEYSALRITQYRKKHNKAPNKQEIKKYLNAYKKGTSEKWRNPNSIDLESLRTIKNIGSYIGKYMSKEHKKDNKTLTEQEKKTYKNKLAVDGRLWYSSNPVSKMKNLKIEAFEPEFFEFTDMLSDPKNQSKIYETDYTVSLSVPIDKLHKQGFSEIPKLFFDYANDCFNGFNQSDFDNVVLNRNENIATPGQKEGEKHDENHAKEGEFVQVIQGRLNLSIEMPKITYELDSCDSLKKQYAARVNIGRLVDSPKEIKARVKKVKAFLKNE